MQVHFPKEQFNAVIGIEIDRESEHNYLSALVVMAVAVGDLSDGDVGQRLLEIINDRILDTAPEG